MAEKELKNIIEPVDTEVNPVPRLNIPNSFLMFQTVSSAPTIAPTSWMNQIQIYTNGGTLRLYWYDNVGNTWHYVTATA